MWFLMNVVLVFMAIHCQSSPVTEDPHNSHSRMLPPSQTLRSETEIGPLRIKYLNPEGIPIDAIIDGVSTYFRNALKVKRRLAPIVVPTCEGVDINEENADFVIIIKPDPAYSLAGGTAVVCKNEESALEHPIAAAVFIGSIYQTTEEYYMSLIGGTLRALAITFPQVQKWKKNQLGELYDQNPLILIQNVPGTVQDRYYINTPKVMEKLREAFNYQDIPGLMIENEPFLMTTGIIAWELRYYRGDVMAFSFFSELYVSTLDLAVLEDSGWYFPDYSWAEVPFMGRGEGAGYFSETCIMGEQGLNPDHWCENIGDICSYSSLKIAFCYPTEFYIYYFMSEGCAYPLEAIASCRVSFIGPRFSYESFGYNSRCFKSSLVQAGQEPSYYHQPICFEVLSCTDTKVLLKIGESTAECSFNGEVISVEGFAGELKCPSSRDVCQEVPCLNFCSGYGNCNHGVCQCLPGRYGHTCEKQCPSECSACTGLLACTSCHPGFYLTEGACLRCSPSCLTCTSETICQSCVDGFYLSRETCVECYSACKSCSGSNQCTECKAGFDLIGTYCCSSSCLSCTHQSCQSCKEHYYLITGVCIDCPEVCGHCMNNVCDQCIERFYLTEGFCSPCPSYCLRCESSLVCTLCEDGKFRTDSGVCVECPSRCSICSANICQECNSGYYLNGPICCPDGCATCSLEVCWTCNPDYLLKDGECLPCPDSCTSCLNGVCQGCKDHYYLSSTICAPCTNNCNTCESSTHCNSCIDPFFLIDTACVTCPTVCSSCQSSVCFECIAGYFKYQNICCPSTCGTCNLEVCWTCKDTYFLAGGNCIDCPEPCTSCKNGVCEGCVKGFYLSGASCTLCPTGCSACVSATSCSECSSGYYLDGNSCLACPAFCTTCQGTQCSTCVTGYKLSGTSCKLFNGGTNSQGNNQCGANCVTCLGKNCIICQTGFYPSSGVCLSCASRCNQCVGLWDCTQCKDGNHLLYGVCCPDTCSSCSTSICYGCKKNFFLQSGSCIDCPASCTGCNSGVCTGCQQGFYSSGTSCAQCPAGCSACSSINWCISCETGYTLSNGKCI